MHGLTISSIFLTARYVANRVLEKGIAVSVAIVRRDKRYQYAYRATDWDNRCKECLEGDVDEREDAES